MESNVGGKCSPSDSDSDSENIFHNEFSDSEDDSYIQSVRDCNVVETQNEEDSINVQISLKNAEIFNPVAIIHFRLLSVEEPETSSLNDMGIRDLHFGAHPQTDVPHRHKKPGRNKNSDGGKPKSTADILKKDSNSGGNCDNKNNTDSKDLRYSDKFFGEDSEDFVSGSIETGIHDITKSKKEDSLRDTGRLQMAMEGHDRNQSSIYRDFEINITKSNKGNEVAPIFDKSCQQILTMSAQENLSFSDWNSSWTTNDFLLCPISISKVDLMTSSHIGSEAQGLGHHDHSGRHKTHVKQKQRMLQMFHCRKKNGKKLIIFNFSPKYKMCIISQEHRKSLLCVHSLTGKSPPSGSCMGL